MKTTLIGMIVENKTYRIEDDERLYKPTKAKDVLETWKNTRVIYDGASYPEKHRGHIVRVIKYRPPSGACYAGAAEVECVTCGKILDLRVSDQFLEELEEAD